MLSSVDLQVDVFENSHASRAGLVRLDHIPKVDQQLIGFTLHRTLLLLSW